MKGRHKEEIFHAQNDVHKIALPPFAILNQFDFSVHQRQNSETRNTQTILKTRPGNLFMVTTLFPE